MQEKKQEEDKIEHKINRMNEEDLHEEEDDLGIFVAYCRFWRWVY